jgi:hypothetical protein
MNNITKIYELLNLNSKKYKIVEWNEKKTTKEDELETIILTIKCLDKFVFCPYC